MTTLEASSVAVVREARRILDGASVSFSEPGLTAVIGPNGAGKSTLLAVLAGLVKPEVGAVLLDGAPIAAFEKRALARRRAYLPQNARCEWPISVERVVALGLTPSLPPFGALAPEDRERVNAMLESADLMPMREQTCTTLSGGELARAMLARAMVGDPELLIADEPIAGLDPRHAIDAMARLRAHADKGRMVIVALHDLSLAAAYADRMIAMKAARIAADGAPAHVIVPDILREVFDANAAIARDADGVAIRFSRPT